MVPEKRPHVKDGLGGQGVSAQNERSNHLVAWFEDLAARLKAVVVLNRSWESALTPTLLMRTPSRTKKRAVAVFLDPPYRTEERHGDIYESDRHGTASTDAAEASYEWAISNGHNTRIAYCCHVGDFDLPAGWTSITTTFAGITDPERQKRRDLIMFSPACENSQLSLLD